VPFVPTAKISDLTTEPTDAELVPLSPKHITGFICMAGIWVVPAGALLLEVSRNKPTVDGLEIGWSQYARDITIHPHAACASCSKGLTEHWFSAPRQSVRWRLTSLAKGLDGAPPCAGAVNLLAQSEYCLLFQIFEGAAMVIPTKGIIILAVATETNVTSLHRPIVHRVSRACNASISSDVRASISLALLHGK